MMKKIIYTRPDSGLSVMTPTGGARLAKKFVTVFGIQLFGIGWPVPVEQITRKWRFLGTPEWTETEDEFVARIAAKDVPPDVINLQFVDESAVPQDRTFRNAWRQSGASIRVDLPIARTLVEKEIETRRR